MKIFSLLRKDLLLLLRDRAELAMLFLMPLAFIIPISLALGSGDGYGVRARDQMMTITVIDYDRGPRAQVLLTAAGESLRIEKALGADLIASLGLQDDPDCALPVTEATPEPAATAAATAAMAETAAETEKTVDKPACLEKAGRYMLLRSWRPALLIIPQDFSKTVDAGGPVDVTLLFDPAADPVQAQQIEGVIKGATIKLSLQNQVGRGFSQLNEMAALAPENVRASIEEQAATPQPADQKPALQLEKVTPQSIKNTAYPDTYQQTIPGYTVMFLFFIITSLAGSIRAERAFGTFRRLLSAPVTRAEIVGGKLLATMLVGLVQVFLIFAVGVVLFKLQLGNDPLAFFLLTLAMVGAAAAIGLAAATTRLRGAALSAPLIIAALLGGCMFPLDLMPPFLRAVSLVTPHRWALSGYQDLMVRGQDLQGVLPQIGVLAVIGLLFFFIAMQRFNFENQEAD